MRAFLRSNSLFLVILLAASCASPYKKLVPDKNSGKSALIYKPQYDKVLYRCTVNGRIVFKRFHLSGLLFFKQMENGTVRAIFQNEMGFTFFDFEWSKDDSFMVRQIIPELDKPALVKTLRKDMNLLLMKGLDRSSEKSFTDSRGKREYNRFTLSRGYAYYVSETGKLEQIENAGEKKKVITIKLMGKEKDNAMPDSVFFDHRRANFTIALHKIESHVDE